MKKLSVIAILLISIFVFTACGGSAAPDFAPFWGQTTDDIDGILERSEYKVSVAPLIDDKGNAINKDEYKLDPSSSGTYKIEISKVKDKQYKVKTEFEFDGKYNKNGTLTDDFTDSYTGECTFEIDAPDKLIMEKSSRVAEMTYCDENGKLSSVKYKVENNYADSKVVSNLTINDDEDNILKDCKSSFESGFGDYFFDNEAMFLAIRALKPKDGFDRNFNVPENIAQKIVPMNAKFVEQKDSELNLTINGTVTKVNSNLIRVVITGTERIGAPINLYYSKDDKVTFELETGTKVNTEYHKLLKIEHGDMIYTLTAYSNLAKMV